MLLMPMLMMPAPLLFSDADAQMMPAADAALMPPLMLIICRVADAADVLLMISLLMLMITLMLFFSLRYAIIMLLMLSLMLMIAMRA